MFLSDTRLADIHENCTLNRPDAVAAAITSTNMPIRAAALRLADGPDQLMDFEDKAAELLKQG